MTSPFAPATTSLIRLTQAQFNAYMRPQLQAFLSEHAEELTGHTVDEDQALFDLYDLVHGQSKLEWSLPPRASAPLPDVGVSPACLTAVVGVAIGCVALVIQAAGVPSSITRAVATTVVDDAIAASPYIANTLQAEVTALMQANGIYNQAKAVFALFGSIGNVVPISKILSAIKDELSWYQWILVGVVITAQLTMWFATGGVAAIAELILFGSAIAGLVMSATQAYSACNAPAGGFTTLDPPPALVSIDGGAEWLMAMQETGAVYNRAPGGTWTSSNFAAVDFSLGLANTPLGHLWLISQNGEEDGPISYVNASGQQISTGANAGLISTADDGETWAIQSSPRATIRWDASARQWSPQPDVFDQIAISSADLQWAIRLAGDQASLWQRTSPTYAWTKVAASPEATDIIQIATNAAGQLVCVTTDNHVFQYLAAGSTWIQLGGAGLTAQTICIRDPKSAWLIDLNGQAQPFTGLLPSANSVPLQWDTVSV